jgi:hypothetical protein
MGRILPLLIAPFSVVIVLPGAALFLDSSNFFVFCPTLVEICKALSLSGCLVAAVSTQSEHLRRAWLFLGLCMALLLLGDITKIPIDFFSPPGWDLLRALLVIAANASFVLGISLIARTLHTVGLALPGSELNRQLFVLLAVLLALSLAGPAITLAVHHLMEGQAIALTDIASGLGNAISLFLIAPVFLTARALRGGLLAWPWILLTASLVCWLFNNAANALPQFGINEFAHLLVAETFRCLALMFTCIAGVSQRLAHHPKEPSG